MTQTRPKILGVPTDPITFDNLLEQIAEWVQRGDRLYQICTVNPEFIMIAMRNRAFFDLLNRSALNTLDGWGAVWVLRWRGVDVPQRVTGSDGVPLIIQRAAREGWRVFLLGAWGDTSAQAAQIFKAQHPALQIAGTYAGSPRPKDAEEIIKRVNDAQTDILLVAYGAPNQDLWIDRYRERLNVKVAMGVGGVFDFVTGNIPRAPLWMRQWGLEWLYRLYLQPSRWRRMLRLPLFLILALIFGSRLPFQNTPS